jgi:hypothetical protein
MIGAHKTVIPCYVSGAGMLASETTWSFKTLVIGWLERSGLGYDTRFRYYRAQFPQLSAEDLARQVSDPIEFYDRDWPAYRDAEAGSGLPEEEALAKFVLERDARFRNDADAAIYCFDEAGVGSGINVMRFVYAGKPVLGFYSVHPGVSRINLTNVLQLGLEFPDRVWLAAYRTGDDIMTQLGRWLPRLTPAGKLRAEQSS